MSLTRIPGFALAGLVAALLVLVASPVNAQPSFSSPEGPFSLDGATGAIYPAYRSVTGDFDGDGLLDYAVMWYDFTTNQGGCSVMLNAGGWGSTGGGSFSTGPSFAVLPSPSTVHDLAAVDLNKDGNDDIVLGTDGGITILIADGMGGFSPELSPPTITGAVYAVTAGLFDGINLTQAPDLVLRHQDTIEVVLVSATITGPSYSTLTPLQTVWPGGYPGVDFDIAAGHFNNDSFLDIVTYPNQLSVLHGNNDGTFAAPVVYGPSANGPQRLAVGDLNNDNYDDIALARLGELAVWMSGGSGGYGVTSYLLPSALGPSLADCYIEDLDGVLGEDLATRETWNLAVFANDGSGNFSSYTASTFAVSGSCCFGDINGDNLPDLLYSTDVSGARYLNVCLNTSLLQNPTYPGSGDDLVLRSGVDNPPNLAMPALAVWPDIHSVNPGGLVVFNVDSPGGSLHFQQMIFGYNVWHPMNSSNPYYGDPMDLILNQIDLWLDPRLPGWGEIYWSGPIYIGWPALTPGGATFAFITPPGLSGYSLRIQGVIPFFLCMPPPPPPSNNQVFTTDAHEIIFL